MIQAAQPITAIITWQASTAPNVPGAHHYRATVNTKDGPLENIEIGRPGVEVWHADQLVYPLSINSRIHGEQVGQYFQWVYCERPVVGTCDDTDPTHQVPPDDVSTDPVPGDGPRPIGNPTLVVPVVPAAPPPAAAQRMADELVVSILLSASPAKLAALGQAIAIATQNKQA